MTHGPLALLPLEDTLDGALGLQILDTDEEVAHGRFAVEDRVRQPYGVVHGGAYAALAESLASFTTHTAVAGEGMYAMGQSNLTSLLRPVSAGTVRAEALRVHRGRSSWVWEVRFTDDEGRLCALSRVTMAVRPATGD
jgi:1,4-dihydroxy-2-naphthoyl-CoA hydrolase